MSLWKLDVRSSVIQLPACLSDVWREIGLVRSELPWINGTKDGDHVSQLDTSHDKFSLCKSSLISVEF